MISSRTESGGSGTGDEPERDLSEPRRREVRRGLLSVRIPLAMKIAKRTASC